MPEIDPSVLSADLAYQSLKVPAKDLQSGDVINFGPMMVLIVGQAVNAGARMAVSLSGPGEPAVYLLRDALVPISRPDRDHALVLRVAKAIAAATGLAWENVPVANQPAWIALARSALQA